mmetsp:Transcript_91853/g.264947  ORF Transcript_91853/g.264947 Transcript_91853/m.264947 type:complete len:239 (-) Transcript_91853:1127-1843(-)
MRILSMEQAQGLLYPPCRSGRVVELVPEVCAMPAAALILSWCEALQFLQCNRPCWDHSPCAPMFSGGESTTTFIGKRVPNPIGRLRVCVGKRVVVPKIVAPNNISVLGELLLAVHRASALVPREATTNTLPPVVRVPHTEVVPLLVHALSRLRSHLEAVDDCDPELARAGHLRRVLSDHLVHQIPNNARHVRGVHIAEGVLVKLICSGRAVDVVLKDRRLRNWRWRGGHHGLGRTNAR